MKKCRKIFVRPWTWTNLSS